MTFHNEEYYLPWWIRHHAKLFENGILIDYDSTDHSWEICKWLCPPNWKIVKSQNRDFNVLKLDGEIQEYERTVSGFKMALTTAEFLLTPRSLDEIDRFCVEEHNRLLGHETTAPSYFRTIGVGMVDTTPDQLPTYYQNLVEQKHHGMITGYKGAARNPGEDYFKGYFSRLYHNSHFGNYCPGRHWLLDTAHWQVISNDVFTLKYKYSPWNKTTIDRLQQFKNRVPQQDLDVGFCLNHCYTEDVYREEYEHYLTTAHDLRDDPYFARAYDYCMGL